MKVSHQPNLRIVRVPQSFNSPADRRHGVPVFDSDGIPPRRSIGVLSRNRKNLNMLENRFLGGRRRWPTRSLSRPVSSPSVGRSYRCSRYQSGRGLRRASRKPGSQSCFGGEPQARPPRDPPVSPGGPSLLSLTAVLSRPCHTRAPRSKPRRESRADTSGSELELTSNFLFFNRLAETGGAGRRDQPPSLRAVFGLTPPPSKSSRRCPSPSTAVGSVDGSPPPPRSFPQLSRTRRAGLGELPGRSSNKSPPAVLPHLQRFQPQG